MKKRKIFCYGILQKRHSAENFGLTDEMYIGRAVLPGFRRNALTAIYKSKDSSDKVEGDIWEVPDDIEEQLYRFESRFGYKREITYPIRVDDGKEFETISYLL